MAASSSSPPMSSPRSASQTSPGPDPSPPARKAMARPPPATRVYGRRRPRSVTPSDKGADDAMDEVEDFAASDVPPVPLPPDSDELYDLQRSDGRKRGLSRRPSWSSDSPDEPEEHSTPTRPAYPARSPEGVSAHGPSTDEIEGSPSPPSGDEADPDMLPSFVGAMAGKMKGRSAGVAASAAPRRRVHIGRPGERRQSSPRDTGARRLELAESSKASDPMTRSNSASKPTTHDAKQSRVKALVQRRKEEAAAAATAASGPKKPTEKGARSSLGKKLLAELEDDGEGWGDLQDVFLPSNLPPPERGTSNPPAIEALPAPKLSGFFSDTDSDGGLGGPQSKRTTKGKGPKKIKPLSRREQIEMEKETQRLNAQNKNEAARHFIHEAQSRRKEGKTFGVSELHELMQRKAKRSDPGTAGLESGIKAGGVKSSAPQSGPHRARKSMAMQMEESEPDDDGAPLDAAMQPAPKGNTRDIKPNVAALLARTDDSHVSLDDDDEIEIEQPPRAGESKLGRLGNHLFGKSKYSPQLRSTPGKVSLPLTREPALFAQPKTEPEMSTPVGPKKRVLQMTTPSSLQATLWSSARQQTRRKNDQAKLIDRGLGPKAPGGFVLPTSPFFAAPEKDEESGSEYAPDQEEPEDAALQYSGESEADDEADGADEAKTEEEPAALAAPSDEEAEEDDTVCMPAPRPRRVAVAADSEDDRGEGEPSKVLAKQTQSSRPGSHSPQMGEKDQVLAQASLPVSQVSNLQSQSDFPPPGQAGIRFSQHGVLGSRSGAVPWPSQSEDQSTDNVLGNFFAPTQGTGTQLPTQAFTESTEASVVQSSGPPLAGETRPSSVLGSAFDGSDANPAGLSQFFASTQGFSQADTSGALDAAPAASILGGTSDALGAAFDAPTQTQRSFGGAATSQADGVLAAAQTKDQSKKDGFAALRARQPVGLDWEDDPLPAIATFDAERYEAEADEAEKQRVWAERRALLEAPQMYMNKRGLYTQTKPGEEQDDSDDEPAKFPLETQSPLPLVTNTQSPFGVGESPFPRPRLAAGDTSIDTIPSVPRKRKRFHRAGSPSLQVARTIESVGSDGEADFAASPLPEKSTGGADVQKGRTAFDKLMDASKRPTELKADKKRLKRSLYVEGEAEESDSDEDRVARRQNKMAGVWSDDSDGEKSGEEAETDSEDDGADLEDLVNNVREADEANKDELVAAKARQDREAAEADLEKQLQRVTEGKWRNRQGARSGFDATLDQDADDARDMRLAARPGAAGLRSKRHLDEDGLDALARDPNAASFLRTYEQSHATLQGDMDFLAAPEQSDEEDAAYVDEDEEQSPAEPADSRDIYRQIQEDKKAQRASWRHGIVDDEDGSSEEELPAPLHSATKRRRREDPWSRILRPESDDELEADRVLARGKKVRVEAQPPLTDDTEYYMHIPTVRPRADAEQESALFSTMTESMVSGGSSAVTSLARPTRTAHQPARPTLPPRPSARPTRSALDTIAHRRGKFED